MTEADRSGPDPAAADLGESGAWALVRAVAVAVAVGFVTAVAVGFAGAVGFVSSSPFTATM